jgi:sec-independent protein translocase protein TatC
MTLVKIGLLSYQTMSNTRSYAVLTIFVVGAIITPTGDALTLSLLAVPMCLLYEICIWLAYFNRKKELAAEALEEAEVKEYMDQQNESYTGTTPVPVPGRISTDDEGDHADYHDAYHDDHADYQDHNDGYHDEHYGEEGEEFDDGKIEDFSKTIDSDGEESEQQEDDASYEDDDTDYNSSASFEAPPKVAEEKDPQQDEDDVPPNKK